MAASEAATSALTPLVEIVALAASNGWALSQGASEGELDWSRGANRVTAMFARSSQRPQYCALFNHTAAEGTKNSELGTVVWRGVGNGGDSDEAAASLRRWFTQPVRDLTDPTQW